MHKNLRMGITDKMSNETQHFKDILRFGDCDGCGQRPGTDMHTCPFAEDIHDDHNEICNCCSDCVHNCADDI